MRARDLLHEIAKLAHWRDLRRIVVVVAALLAVSVLVAGGFTVYGDKPDRGYITAPIERGSIDKVVKATGTVNPVVMVEVGSELSGQVSEVLVNFNDPVKKSQVIARINPERYTAGVTVAKADLKIAMASAQVQKAAL